MFNPTIVNNWRKLIIFFIAFEFNENCGITLEPDRTSILSIPKYIIITKIASDVNSSA